MTLPLFGTFSSPEGRSDCEARSGHGGSPDMLNLFEARLLHQSDKIPNRDRSSNSLRLGVDAAREFFREIRFQSDIGALQTTVGPKYTMNLPERFLFTG